LRGGEGGGVFLAGEAEDGDGGGSFGGALLDLFPSSVVGAPGVGGLLLCGEGRGDVSGEGGVDGGQLDSFAVGPSFDRPGIGEDEFDAPDGDGGVLVAPGELRGDYVWRIDGVVGGTVDDEGGKWGGIWRVHGDGVEVGGDGGCNEWGSGSGGYDSPEWSEPDCK